MVRKLVDGVLNIGLIGSDIYVEDKLNDLE